MYGNAGVPGEIQERLFTSLDDVEDIPVPPLLLSALRLYRTPSPSSVREDVPDTGEFGAGKPFIVALTGTDLVNCRKKDVARKVTG